MWVQNVLNDKSVPVAMATPEENSNKLKSEDVSFSLPEPPEKPQDSDCCGTGCIPCVFDIYEEEMSKWRMECDKIRSGKSLNKELQLGDHDEVVSTSEFRSFALVSITRLTGNSCLYRFKIPGNKKLGLQIGQHLIMRWASSFFFTIIIQIYSLTSVKGEHQLSRPK